MKKSITVSNLTLDLYLDYIRPTAIAAGILEQITTEDGRQLYITDAAAADEIAHCMYIACMGSGMDDIERTHEEFIRYEAERMIYQLTVSIQYDITHTAETLAPLLAAMTEALQPTDPAEAAQTAPQTPTTDEQKEEENTMNNTAFTPFEAAMHAATVRGIIRRQGGYREREIINHPHTVERGETWNEAHKVVYILAATPDPDGYRDGCAVDIVTRSIVG